MCVGENERERGISCFETLLPWGHTVYWIEEGNIREGKKELEPLGRSKDRKTLFIGFLANNGDFLCK